MAFQERYNHPAEFVGFLEIHQMADATYHHAPGIGYARLDRACMRMNVWNVSVANKQQGWDVDLAQPRQCWLDRQL